MKIKNMLREQYLNHTILPQQKIKELQLKRLRETVHLVYDTVPFYQKKFKELNFELIKMSAQRATRNVTNAGKMREIKKEEIFEVAILTVFGCAAILAMFFVMMMQ